MRFAKLTVYVSVLLFIFAGCGKEQKTVVINDPGKAEMIKKMRETQPGGARAPQIPQQQQGSQSTQQ